ncbi:MAG: hypothetical protein EBR09_02025 [Proteobacteria bacterium]|nr:hypothetical protein [Pseudomonadota bacterium]
MAKRVTQRFGFLPLTITVVGVVGASCGLRETRSSSATSLIGMQRASSNVGAVTATPKVSVQLDEIRKQLRDATEFWKLSLAQESKERKEADASIRADVLSLGEKLESLRGFLNSEISRLDKTLRDEFTAKLAAQEQSLSDKISTEKSEREKAISVLDGKLSLTAAALRQETKNAIDSTQRTLQAAETEINKKIANLDAGLQAEAQTRLAQLKSLEEKTDKNAAVLKVDLTKKIADLASQMASNIEANKAAADDEFKKLQGELGLANLALVRQRQQLDDQITALGSKTDAESAALKSSLESARTALGLKISDLELVTKDELNAVRDTLENKIMASESGLSDLITLAREEAQTSLVAAVGATSATLVSVMSEADKRLREELTKQIASESDKQAEALQAFKKEVDATYAKQVDLIALQNVVTGLSNALNILDHKVVENDKRLESSIKNLRTDLVGQISNVKATVESLRGDFTKHVAVYNGKVAELAEQTRSAARDLRKELAAAAAHDETSRAKLAESIEKLNVKLTNTEDFAIKTREALNGKIVELERRDGELTNEIRNARKDATAELSSAIAKEQQARQAIADDVKALQKEVERVSQVASQALTLSKANQLAIAGVSADLESAKKTFGAEIQKLRTDMQTELNALREQSSAIMQGLGLSSQAHFTETAAQLKDVNGKISGLMREMGRAIQKGIMQSTDPVQRTDANSAAKAKEFNDAVSLAASVQVDGGKVTLQEYAAQRMDEFSKVLGRVESEFLLAIDYAEVLNDKTKTDDLRAMNKSFIERVVSLENKGAKVCQDGDAGKISNGIPMLMASVNGHEFWAHLARTYVQLTLGGSRVNDGKDGEYDKMFFGSQAVADGQSFQSSLALASAPSHSEGAGGECMARVSDWAKSVLFGGAPESVRLRAALRARTGLENLVRAGGQLEVAYRGLKDPAEKIETVAKEKLMPAFGNTEAKVVAYLRNGDGKGDPGFYASAAQIISEYQYLAAQQRALNHNFNALTNAALEARAEAQAENIATRSQLQTQINELKGKLAKIDVIQDQVKTLSQAQANSFGLIAAMAARLGYGDLVDKTKTEIAKVADLAKPDPSLTFALGCSVTSHYFNYANEGQPLQRCDSGVSTSDGNMGDNGKCRTSQTNVTTNTTNIHTNTHTTSNYTQYQTYGSVQVVNTRGCQYGPGCWSEWTNLGLRTHFTGNTTSQSTATTTTQSSSVEYEQAFIGVLTAPQLSPLSETAQAILKRAAGSPFPSDRKTMIGLRILGQAAKWKIEDPETGRSITLNASDFKSADTAKGLVYELPASMFLAKTNGQAGFTEAAKISALDNNGDVKGKTCLHSMNGGTHNVTRSATTYSSSSSSSSNYQYGGTQYMYGYYGTRYYTSPLVLDLVPNRKLSTVAPDESKAMFDLQATGMKQRVGWIAKGTGLLALDINGNGAIDNGRELFGDFTKLKSGALAANGYDALADHDTNKDGMIDKNDRVYRRLMVWTDDNGDGVTQKGELHKLSKLGISGISVKFENAAAEERIQNRGNVKNNLVLYKSRYFGSNCPANGCRSYDVYFGFEDLVKPVAVK